METGHRVSPGIRVINRDGRSYILLEEHILILMNFFAPLLLLHFSGRIELLAEAENWWTSLAATTTEMPVDCFFRFYDELNAVLVDRLSEARRGDGSRIYGEGCSSHSEAPQVLNAGSAVERARVIPAWEIINPAQKDKVSIGISEHGKDPFADSNGSPPQREKEPNRKGVGCSGMTASKSNLHSKAPEIINDSSDDMIIAPPGRYVTIDIPSVVTQEYEENVGGEVDGRKREYIGDGSNKIHSDRINSLPEQHVSIDIPSFVYQQQWNKEDIGGEPDRKKRNNSMISKMTLAITGQAVGTLLSSVFPGSSHPSWTANFVAVAIVLGIAFTLLGIGLRRDKPMLSGIMAKLGAVATASAIILALGLTVIPSVAWTAGTVACLIIAIGVAMA